jgi:hypothetical protein
VDDHAVATARLLEESAEGRLRVDMRDWPPSEDLPAGVYRTPTWVWRDADGSDAGWRLEGVPTGYVFSAVVQVTLDLMTEPTAPRPVLSGSETARLVILVAPTSPYCPHVIRVGYFWARRRPGLVARVVDVASFPAWAAAAGITHVPRVCVVDGRAAISPVIVGVPDFTDLWAAVGGQGMAPLPAP